MFATLQEAAASGNETTDEVQRKRVVNILIQMQKLAELNVGLKHVRLQCVARCQCENPSERKPVGSDSDTSISHLLF